MILFYFRNRLKKLIREVNKLQQHTLLIILLGMIVGMICFRTPVILFIIILLSSRIITFKNFLLLCSFIFLGFLYSSHTMQMYEHQTTDSTEMTLRVIEHPIMREFDTQIIVSIDNLQGFGIAKVPKYTNVTIGSVIKAEVQLQQVDKNSRYDESYRQYLFSKQIWYDISIAEIISIQESLDPATRLSLANTSISQIINRLVNEPYTSLLNGIVIGRRESLPKDVKDELSITGLSHIISTSGMHVVLLISFLDQLRGPLHRQKVQILTVIILILFIFLIGIYNIPAMRAIIMGIILILSQMIGRPISKIAVLLYTIFIVLLLYPFYAENISVQLSFFATIGLLFLLKPIQKHFFPFKFIPKIIKESLAISIAANITTLPITLSTFGTFSAISFLSNIIIAPFIPLMMLLYPIVILIDLVHVDLVTKVISWILEVLSKLMIEIVSFLSHIPHASVDAKFGYLFLIGVLLILIFIDFKKFRTRFVLIR